MQDSTASLVPPDSGKTHDLRDLAGLFLRKEKWATSRVLVLLIITSATEGLSLLLLVPLLQLLQHAGSDWSIAAPVSWLGGPFKIGLTEALVAICCLVGVQTLLNRSKTIALSRLLLSVVNGLRLDLFSGVANARWQFAGRVRAADLNTLLTTDIDRVQGAAFSFLQLANSAVVILAYVAVSLIISPAMTLFAAGIGLLIFLVMRPIRSLTSAYGRKLSLQRQEQSRIMMDFLFGLKVVKSFNAEHRHLDTLSSNLKQTEVEAMRYVRATSSGSAALQISNAVALSIFIYAAIVGFGLSIDRLVVLILLYLRLSPRFMALLAGFQDILLAGPSLRAVNYVRAQSELNRETHSSGSMVPFKEVRFDNVSFQYPSGAELAGVRSVSFVLRANRVTALIGPSGAGKSTVADLMTGLLVEQSGSIRIDGVALDDTNRRAWRDQVAYVPQDTFLLHDTIEGNIRLAKPDASDDEIWTALRAANAEAFVRGLPAGLQSIVGDRGSLMSGGERQRVALARALLRRPRLLILDEATNALDRENQALINQSINALRSEMAVLIIAHHPSMVVTADEIIAIEAGEVVETGTTELLRSTSGSRLSRFMGAAGAP